MILCALEKESQNRPVQPTLHHAPSVVMQVYAASFVLMADYHG